VDVPDWRDVKGVTHSADTLIGVGGKPVPEMDNKPIDLHRIGVAVGMDNIAKTVFGVKNRLPTAGSASQSDINSSCHDSHLTLSPSRGALHKPKATGQAAVKEAKLVEQRATATLKQDIAKAFQGRRWALELVAKALQNDPRRPSESLTVDAMCVDPAKAKTKVSQLVECVSLYRTNHSVYSHSVYQNMNKSSTNNSISGGGEDGSYVPEAKDVVRVLLDSYKGYTYVVGKVHDKEEGFVQRVDLKHRSGPVQQDVLVNIDELQLITRPSGGADAEPDGSSGGSTLPAANVQGGSIETRLQGQDLNFAQQVLHHPPLNHHDMTPIPYTSTRQAQRYPSTRERDSRALARIGARFSREVSQKHKMPLVSDPNRSPPVSQIQAEAEFQAFLDAKQNCQTSDVSNLMQNTGKASLLEGGRSLFRSTILNDGEEIDAILVDLDEGSACSHIYDRANQMGKLRERQVEDQTRFLQERLTHQSPAPGESFFDNPAVIPPSSAAKESLQSWLH